MRRRGSKSSWSVGVDAPDHLNIALFVRGAAGLARHGDPWSSYPPWPPEFADRGIAASQVERARAEWSRWWQSLCALPSPPSSVEDAQRWMREPSQVFDPPEFESLANAEQLQRVCRRLWPAADQWWTGPAGAKAALTSTSMRRRFVGEGIGQVVRRFERTNRRPANFALHLDILYVDTDRVELLAEDRALLGARLPVAPRAPAPVARGARRDHRRRAPLVRSDQTRRPTWTGRGLPAGTAAARV